VWWRTAFQFGPLIFFVATLLGVLLAAVPLLAESELVVHEWGTFTSFQDPLGDTIGGINVDDEPVPEFVHRLWTVPIWTRASRPALWSQGAPRCHPDVTLRLETPVVYFYPPEKSVDIGKFRFGVRFRGGWLTEYFPAADAGDQSVPGSLTSASEGHLEWQGLRLGEADLADLPQTSEHVWLAPRRVGAATVTTSDGGESEKYLFYRGVGHLDAPFVASRQDRSVTIALRGKPSQWQMDTVSQGWLVHVLPDQRLVYSTVRLQAMDDRQQWTVPLPGAGTAAPASQRAKLRTELRQALIEAGLFPDEAEAMLATWELSYFKSGGLRFFFVLPRDWIDHYLPISLSVPASMTRVMMGRIELVSPHQQRVLEQIYELPSAELERTPIYLDLAGDRPPPSAAEEEQARWQETYSEMLTSSSRTHAEFYEAFGREVPLGLKLHDSLGRFGDAILAHRLRVEASDAKVEILRKFAARFSACIPSRRRSPARAPD